MTGDSLSVLQVCSAREAVYGAVQSLLTLATAQRQAGTMVEFLTFKGKRFGKQVRDLGFCSHEVRVRGKVDPLAIREMARVIRSGGYDVVHTHLSTSSVNGALAARLARVPSVATVHGMSGRLSFAAANHLIAVSGSVRDHLVRQGVPARKISVVYNGVDLEECILPRDEARTRLGLALGVPVVGTVARITPLKGVEDALRAVKILTANLPDLRYLLVGEGERLAACKSLATELGIGENVDFLGYRKDVGACLAAMDLFLFPTLKEAMGIALVEAMAAELPTVSTNVGGIPEVVTSDTGILVGPGEPEALAEASLGLLNDPERMRRLGQAGRNRAREVFGIPAMQAATDAVYRRVVRSVGR